MGSVTDCEFFVAGGGDSTEGRDPKHKQLQSSKTPEVDFKISR